MAFEAGRPPLVNHASYETVISGNSKRGLRKRAFPEQQKVRNEKQKLLARDIGYEGGAMPNRLPTPKAPISNAQIAQRLLCDPMNILLIAGPVGIFLAEMNKEPGGEEEQGGGAVVFVLCFIGLVPLAKLLGDATEHLAENLNETIGGLLNATFGNAVEMIITISAIRDGELPLVKQSLLGSILSNLLLVLGMAFFFGGITRFEQSFSGGAALINITMLLVGIMSFSLPTVFAFGAPKGATLMISRVCAIFVAIGYIAYLVFQLYTHAEFFEDGKGDDVDPSSGVEFLDTDGEKITVKANECGKLNYYINGHLKVCNLSKVEAFGRTLYVDGTSAGDWVSTRHATVPPGQEEVVTRTVALFAQDSDDEAAILGVPWALGLLLICTVIVAELSEYMVSAIDGLVTDWGVPKAFVGVILLPIVGNACEHASAIRMAYNDKVATAIAIAIGSSTQIAIFVMPFSVLTAEVFGQSLDLNLQPTGLSVLFLSVLVVFSIVMDGKSNWLEGFMLTLSYCLVGVLYWFTPQDMVDE